MAEKNRVLIFLMLTAIPLLLYSSTPLNVINTEKEVIGPLTTGDLFLSTSLFAALTALWIFVIRKRV